MAFAERAGYLPNQHLFESKLDVQSCDTSLYMAPQIALEQKGYRFFSLEEAGHNEENARRLHALDTDSDADTPGVENWGPRTFEQYVRDEHDSFGFTPSGVFIAEFDGEWVAMSAIRPSATKGQMHVDYTGVLREHRGKGLAKLLKVQTVNYAKSTGAEVLSTHNDERNQAMLGINQKFGFVSEPGFFVYRKELPRD
jgi:RimJ/RimL family protein N-acetyltransferase